MTGDASRGWRRDDDEDDEDAEAASLEIDLDEPYNIFDVRPTLFVVGNLVLMLCLELDGRSSRRASR